MDFNKIDVNRLSFKKTYNNNTNIFYKGEKLNLLLNNIKCHTGIINDGNKYYIEFDLSDNHVTPPIYRFLSDLERIFDKLDKETTYIRFLKRNGIWKIKVPFRYKKFEIDVYKDNELTTTSDIKSEMYVNVNIELRNIWEYNDVYGCLWIIKSIIIP